MRFRRLIEAIGRSLVRYSEVPATSVSPQNPKNRRVYSQGEIVPPSAVPAIRKSIESHIAQWLDRRWRYPPTPRISNEVRLKLTQHALRMYGTTCHWCGRDTYRPHQDERRGLPHHRTLEHLIPRGMGGKDTFANTRIACYECNQKRAVEQEYEIWLHRLRIMAPNRLFGAFIMRDEAV